MAEDSASKQDVAQIATAATAAIAVVTSLAVAGILARAERNHAYYLFGGVLSILVGSLLWFIAALLPTTWRAPLWLVQWRVARVTPAGTIGERQSPTRIPIGLIRVVASLFFFGGLIAAVWGVLETQKDAQRPTVSASFDATKNVLTAKVSADGLSTDQRMALRVDPLKQEGESSHLNLAEPTAIPLYFALLGPDADGKVKYEFSVYVPKEQNVVGVEAWTADTKPPCLDVKPKEQSKEAGCIIIRLKENRTDTPPPTTTTGQQATPG
jgi:hypothetical protein